MDDRKRFVMNANEKTMNQLTELAEHFGTSKADLLRKIIEQCYENYKFGYSDEDDMK